MGDNGIWIYVPMYDYMCTCMITYVYTVYIYIILHDIHHYIRGPPFGNKKQPRQVGESSKLMVSTHQALHEGQFVGLLLGIIYI